MIVISHCWLALLNMVIIIVLCVSRVWEKNLIKVLAWHFSVIIPIYNMTLFCLCISNYIVLLVNVVM